MEIKAIMDSILNTEKKKGGYNQKEHKDYCDALDCLIQAEGGFSDIVIDYFYKGFSCCEIDPLSNWLRNNDNAVDEIDKILRHSKVKKDSSRFQFKMMMALFGKILNGEIKNCDVINKVILRITEYYILTSKGKPIKDDDRIFISHCVKYLNENFALPDLDMTQINKKHLVDLVERIGLLIEKQLSANIKASSKQKLKVLKQWCVYVVGAESVQEVTTDQSLSTVGLEEQDGAVPENDTSVGPKQAIYDQDGNQEDKDGIGNKLQETGAKDTTEINTKTNVGTVNFHDCITRMQQIFSEFSNNEKSLKNMLREADIKNEQLEITCKKLRDVETSLLFDVDLHKTKNIELATAVKSMKDEISSMKTVLEEKEKEIQSTMEMLNVVRGDQAHKRDEYRNKISKILRTEYSDYESIANMPMTAELGENMRDQLKRIFEEMAKCGFNIK